MRFSFSVKMVTFTAAVYLAGGCAGGADSSNPDEAGGSASVSSSASVTRINPLIALHEQGLPIFGLYAPSARAGRGAPEGPQKTPADLAAETLGYGLSDYVFDGSMEGGVDRGLPAFTSFVDAMREAGATTRTNPLVVKMQEFGTDPAATAEAIAKELDAGVSTIMLVTTESAEQVEHALAAMRYASNGGTRPDRVGPAPAYWGLSDSEYREKADLWPLNPDGELLNWTIVESHEGLAHVREIAAVPGVGVLWPGAGTLRGLFSSTNEAGERVLDEAAWENAIQTVLSACKEFDVPCGFPSNASDIQMRMEQGFSVFVMGWGDAGFETVQMGRGLAGR
ncbi:MAG: aldolase/citrate lyase family protein [Gemmatimonadetes bacterium]|nr:aldolase/citrate lyase family protein [Gemmatimonadota bacterium]